MRLGHPDATTINPVISWNILNVTYSNQNLILGHTANSVTSLPCSPGTNDTPPKFNIDPEKCWLKDCNETGKKGNSILVGGFNRSENISQIGSFPQIGMNIKKIFEST